MFLTDTITKISKLKFLKITFDRKHALKTKKSSKLKISLELIPFVPPVGSLSGNSQSRSRKSALIPNWATMKGISGSRRKSGTQNRKIWDTYRDWALKFLKWGFGTWTQNSKSRDSGLGQKLVRREISRLNFMGLSRELKNTGHGPVDPWFVLFKMNCILNFKQQNYWKCSENYTLGGLSSFFTYEE